MWSSINKLIDPNFKTLNNFKKKKFNRKRKGKVLFNKKRDFRNDKKKSFKNKNKFFKKNGGRKSNFLDKNKSLGYTNNPKYFIKRSDNNTQKKDKKNHSFKGKKRFKNRKRPKNFSFKKFKYKT